MLVDFPIKAYVDCTLDDEQWSTSFYRGPKPSWTSVSKKKKVQWKYKKWKESLLQDLKQLNPQKP